MKHVTLIKVGGRMRLYDDEGLPIDAFTYYTRHLDRSGKAENTKTAYAKHVAQFIDYLIECGCFDPDAPPTEAALTSVISKYPELLAFGVSSPDSGVSQAAESLGRQPLDKSSRQAHVSAVNLFLSVGDTLAKEARELAEALGEASAASLKERPLLELIGTSKNISRFELRRIRQNSILAGNLRSLPSLAEGVRAKRLASGRDQKPTLLEDEKDFPIDHLMSLADAASNPRDKCLWLLMAGGGLRWSEALSVVLPMIDHERRTVRVEDPNGWRGSGRYTSRERLPWKGRDTAKVTMFEPIKTAFFEALAEYLAVRPQAGHDYLFVYLSPDQYGQPLCYAKNRHTLNDSMNDAFRSAQRKVVELHRRKGEAISLAPVYTLHSLRHLYGMYMKNDIWLPARRQFGFDLDEVQILMGHESIETTRKYAKSRRELIDMHLEAADRFALGQLSYEDMPSFLANRYRQFASELEAKSVRPLLPVAGEE